MKYSIKEFKMVCIDKIPNIDSCLLVCDKKILTF